VTTPATVRPGGRNTGTPARPVASTPNTSSNKPAHPSKGVLVRFAQIFTWIDTPARVALAAYVVVALIVAMWMGARVGRRRARRLADVAADAQLSAVMSIVPDAIVVTDDKNAIKAMNAAAAEMLGTTGEMRGAFVARAIRGSERSGISFESWMRAAEDYPSGTTGTLDNGLPVGIAATPVRADQAVVGHVYLVRDLRKERALDRMKEEFLSNISHELRTPLASALGFARLLQRRELSATQQGAFVGAIVEACERLDRVVDLLIDVAALEGGNARTDAERVDVAAIVREAASRWADRSASHVITARVPTEVPVIAAASALLRNAIDELIDNAIKFSPDGGLVTVSVEPVHGEKKATIAISVADQGIGIDPLKKEAVFDAFHQVDGSATRRFGGLGIGLAFVRRVAEAHDGRVDILSEQGRGSTFSLLLPARAPRTEARRPAASKSGKLIGSPRRPQRVVRIEEGA
jgi:signal transduction histidine kinase